MNIEVDVASQLFPNPFTMAFTLLVTAVLFFFIYKFVFDPARAMIQKRQALMAAELSDAAKAKEEASIDREKAKEEIFKARDMASEIIADAKLKADETKGEILKSANDKADDMYRKAKDRILKEEKEMREGLNDEIVDVALEASKKLLGDKDLSKQDEEAIDRFIRELSDEH